MNEVTSWGLSIEVKILLYSLRGSQKFINENYLEGWHTYVVMIACSENPEFTDKQVGRLREVVEIFQFWEEEQILVEL